MPNKDIRKASVRQLTELLAICTQCAAAYLEAAQHVADNELRLTLRRLGVQRENFCIELERAIISLDCSPHDSNDLGEKSSSPWMYLKTALGTGNDQAVLAECERGEDYAVTAYARVIGEPPHAGPHDELIKAQAAVLQADHDLIRSLCAEPVHAV